MLNQQYIDIPGYEMMAFLSRDLQPLLNLVMDHEASDLFSSKGETWRTVRRTLSPSFSASKMKMVMLIK